MSITIRKSIHFIAVFLGACGIVVAALPGFGVPSNIVSLAAGAVAVAGTVLVYVAHSLGLNVTPDAVGTDSSPPVSEAPAGATPQPVVVG